MRLLPKAITLTIGCAALGLFVIATILIKILGMLDERGRSHTKACGIIARCAAALILAAIALIYIFGICGLVTES